jgi:hypothetical protein
VPCRALTLDNASYDAYEAYNDALLMIIHEGKIHEDLYPWYIRAHEKALRVAMLLASLHGEDHITLPYWAEGQVIVEQWRQSLHELVATVAAHEPLSREARLEERILSMLLRAGSMTKRQLQQMSLSRFMI